MTVNNPIAAAIAIRYSASKRSSSTSYKCKKCNLIYNRNMKLNFSINIIYSLGYEMAYNISRFERLVDLNLGDTAR